jgi:hypothetical protein
MKKIAMMMVAVIGTASMFAGTPSTTVKAKPASTKQEAPKKDDKKADKKADSKTDKKAPATK